MIDSTLREILHAINELRSDIRERIPTSADLTGFSLTADPLEAALEQTTDVPIHGEIAHLNGRIWNFSFTYKYNSHSWMISREFGGTDYRIRDVAEMAFNQFCALPYRERKQLTSPIPFIPISNSHGEALRRLIMGA